MDIPERDRLRADDEIDMNTADLLVGVHQLLDTEQNLTDSLQRVTFLANAAVPAAEGVGLTLRSGDSGTTIAFQGEIAPELDEAQYADDLGPCLEAFRDDRTINVGSIPTEMSRWPSFAKRAAELGVRSSLSLPLRDDQRAVGALNFYATPEHKFEDPLVVVAEAFAAQASVAVTNAAVYWRTRHMADNLTKALDSRDKIGQAKGILMRDLGISAEDAFELIRKTSQNRNIKVADIAEEIIWSGQLPGGA
jgi:GAF domain-containing protein